MNYSLIKYTVSKIIRQPLTALIFLLQLISILAMLVINILFKDNQIIGIDLIGLSLDEPYIIKQLMSNIFSLFFLIIFFLLILIINRYFHEFKNNVLLVIILPKLKTKDTVVYSSFLGIFIIFSISFIVVFFLAFLIFKLRYGISLITYLVHSAFLIISSIIYITSFSLLLNMFLDGFTSSVIMILPVFGGGVVSAWIGVNNVLSTIFNFLFPLNKINNSLALALIGEISNNTEIFFSFIVSIFFIYVGRIYFLKKWE